ncbi:MAG: peptidase M22 [Acutalibacteraceae bacterium]
MLYLGIDTSNYTTSAALYDSENNSIRQVRRLLTVKKGEKGLRQSDAVFSHTQQLSSVISELMSGVTDKPICVGVSSRPRNIESSYMPCFTVGLCNAESIGSVMNIPVHKFSHQQGHIISALYSAKRLDLIGEKFIAFHVSGGTTEALLVTPDENNIINCEIIASSSDLKAGQAVDRVGLMLGLDFPCGMKLDELSQKSLKSYKIKPSLSDGNCSLSGVENKCRKMLLDGEKPEDTAKFCVQYICSSLDKMTEYLLGKYGKLPLVFSGGVMSNTYINSQLSGKYGAYFAESRFSSDNAAGIALLAYLKEKSQ